MNIISAILLLISAGLCARHGWTGVTGNVSPAAEAMMGGLGISRPVMLGLGWLNLLVAGLLFFPPTFLAANLLNAASIVLIMVYALRAGNLKLVLLEVPFLLLPFVLLWLRHPLAK